MILSRPFAALALALSVALTSSASLITHERRAHTPAGWSRSAKHAPTARLPLRIGLTQSNLENIEDYLMEVSHPSSPNYGAHWSVEKVAETFRPAKESVDAVHAWLAEYGIGAERVKSGKIGGHWVEVDVTVEEAEELLDTEYHVYEHEETGKKHIACDSYKVPEHLQKHIDLVTPTVHFDSHIPGRGKPTSLTRRTSKGLGNPGSGVVHPVSGGKISTLLTELADCDQQITPICLRALYEIVYVPLSIHKNSFAIVEYTPESFLQSDLDMFNRNFTPGLVGKPPIQVSIDGGFQQTSELGFGEQGEPDLDLQYGMNLVYPQNVTLYQAGDDVEGASFNNLLDALDASYCTYEGGDDPTQDGIYPDPYGGGYEGPENCGTVKPANVISTSYGYDEADLSPFYAARQCNEYAKLGLMGVTVVYSSGDYGVAGNGGNCLNPDGSQTPNGTLFNPSFPGTCPWVTSVGATQVNPNSTVFEPEGACEQIIYSGGGFSNYFARPSYQASAVASYLKNHHPPYGAERFNQSNSRAYPDISANGANYVVAVDGEFELVYGTSCSAPVSASILTLVNDARLAVGKKPIGFINPTIYSSEFDGAFNDITMGGNQGCGTPGFTAVEGWDPVTGLGTPNFPKLLARWLLLP